jgi:Delta7-sterol 5-desaturase
MSNFLVGGKTVWLILAVTFLRYFIFAFLAFLIYYVIFRKRLSFKKIQKHFPSGKDHFREIAYSLITVVIFTAIGYLVFISPLAEYNFVYYHLRERSMIYFIASIFIMIFLHDVYFYWTHRLMHHKRLFKWMHRVHHLSTNPSPWAAFAFHPFEAVVEAGIIALIPFVMPVHPLAIGIFLTFMMVYNVYGHLGFELYPRWFVRHPLGKWVNTSVNHNLHHEYVTGNYGLYTLIWDRLMGTLRADYEAKLDEVHSRTRDK